MRIWFLHPAYLDNKRLNAAHNEIHTCLSCIQKGRRWGSMTDPFVKSLHYLKTNHDRLVVEMAARDPMRRIVAEQNIVRTHPSPFDPTEFTPEQVSVEFTVTPAHILKDVQDLRNKWEAEHYFFGVGRQDLREMEFEHGIPPGPSGVDVAIRQDNIKLLLTNYKWWFKAYQQVWPKSRLQDRVQAFIRGRHTGEYAVRYAEDGYRLAIEQKSPEQEVVVFLHAKMAELKAAGTRPAPVHALPPETRPILDDPLQEIARALAPFITQPRPQVMQEVPTGEVLEFDDGVRIPRMVLAPMETLQEDWERINARPVRRYDRMNFVAAGQIHPNFPEAGDIPPGTIARGAFIRETHPPTPPVLPDMDEELAALPEAPPPLPRPARRRRFIRR